MLCQYPVSKNMATLPDLGVDFCAPTFCRQKSASKELIEKSRGCHNQRPQPTLTARGREEGQKLTRVKYANKCTKYCQVLTLQYIHIKVYAIYDYSTIHLGDTNYFAGPKF